MSAARQPGAAGVIVRIASWLVPREQRAEWCEEWNAELQARADESGSRRTGRAWGAWADAWYLRRREVAVSGIPRDVRFAARSLRRSPGFTLTAVATLGLGLGALVTLFAVVDAVLLRALPFPQADELVRIDGQAPSGGFLPVSRPDWREWNERQTSFEGIASFLQVTTETALGGREPARLLVRRVSANFFDVLDVQPVFGRSFLSGEEGRGKPAVALLSHGVWTRLFDARQDLDGLELDVLGEPHAVLGVLPADFEFISPADVWVLHEREGLWEVRGWPAFGTVARMRDGVPLERARAEMSAIARAGRVTHGDRTFALDARVTPFRDWLVSGVRARLLTLLAAAGFVLLIACANVASALLARGVARAGEVAIRRALGAGRGRLVREQMLENVLLGLLGSVAGLALAWSGVTLVRLLGAGFIPRLTEVRLDGSIVAFAVLAGFCVAPVFGLLPSLTSARTSPGQTLRGVSRGRRVAMNALVSIEVASATALVAGTILLVRSVIAIEGAPLGWDPRDLLVAEVALPPSRYPDAESRVRWTADFHQALSSMPGVQSAAAVTRLPLDRWEDAAPVYSFEMVSGAARTGSTSRFDDASYSNFRVVHPDYFETMGIRLVQGRGFDARDDANAPDAAILSESLAAELWPGEDPIGRRVRHNNDFGSPDEGWLTVVGVVTDVRHWESEPGAQHELYMPVAQRGARAATMTWVIRSNRGLPALAPGVRERMAALDPSVPLTLRTMDERIAATWRDRRFSLVLLGVFGLTAGLLALVGIAGVVSYVVERRTREIGIRIALGASARTVRRTLQTDALKPAIVGAMAGAAIALALSKFISALLYGVRALDTWSYAGAVLLLVAMAWAASTLPTRRALRMHPMKMLRSD